MKFNPLFCVLCLALPLALSSWAKAEIPLSMPEYLPLAQDTYAQRVSDAEHWQAEWAMLGQQAELLRQAIGPTEQALEQQRQRMEAGFASFRDVQQQQQALLDRQLERVELDTQRAQALIDRLYAQ
ncbi:MAG: hypothetical protein WED11_11465 [Natronospirillum sp.]